MRIHRLHLTGVVLLLVAACGASTTDPAPVVTFPGIRAALTIDPEQLPNYASPTWPVHYDAQVTAPINTPPITDAGATLGRVLFHDTRLSITSTVSCATCHQQARGFTDPATLSQGVDPARRTGAHSMRLLNARFFLPGQAFWDRRAPSIELQVTQPIRDPAEMGFDAAHGGLDSLFRRMRSLAYYPELFSLAFGDPSITTDRVQRALGQFIRSMVSTDSRFDRGFAQAYNAALGDRGVQAPFPSFTAQENRGKDLYLRPPPAGAGCARCHTVPTFALTGGSRSNGLDAGETRIFKSPSLKSVAVTGPYMHDGRLASLEAVVEHYASGVQDGPALDQRLRGPDGTPIRLSLTAADKAALVAFLRTLTDEGMGTDARFGSPFRR